jgi:prohibitin 2
LPLVVGGGGTGSGGQAVTPFIEIPTSRNELHTTQEGGTGNATSSNLSSDGATLQSVLNNTVLTN